MEERKTTIIHVVVVVFLHIAIVMTQGDTEKKTWPLVKGS